MIFRINMISLRENIFPSMWPCPNITVSQNNEILSDFQTEATQNVLLGSIYQVQQEWGLN
jgi:hypothetical protein